ncbi:hypothetical protein [Phenylobacterium deserti]|uniref:Uncharacterized protein n=1 Tax=Phenylobacterium deserti TaxID=1914756 RepID=A0A328ABL8_9CAUL|nr:hypothetical protein [Phenylobacterium deserti]RAK52122.1 hypothetical protein DJ018_13280 [Phenylobacterium deserti]
MEDDELLDAQPMEGEGEDNLFAEEPATADPLAKLYEIAKTQGDISHLLDSTQLANLGARVVEDYELDDRSRASWKTKAQRALDRAAQEEEQIKNYPWDNASNVSYPLLTVAALQFAARAYPAIIKNDEAVKVKVFGTPPESAPPEVQQAASQGDRRAQMAVQAATEALQKRQAKIARAKRVGDYMNYKLFYEIEDWEGDTDVLLHQLPIIGLGYRKEWHDLDSGRCNAAYVSAMRLVVNQDVKNLKTAPRVTEEIPDVYPYQIEGRIRAGRYRQVSLPATAEDDQAPRMLLEQHRMHDLDGDGLEEPYVVTVDKETRQVLRIEAAYTLEGARMGGVEGEERVVGFDRWMPYTKYEFLPDLKGRFHSIGFGHLLDQLTEVVNTSINQMIDAGHAAIAGGGFIASSLRLQGGPGKTNTIRFRPNEYKTVTVAGSIRDAIYERNVPQPSPVMFQVLDLMLGAAKDITSTKDVLTGEANSTAPVGTTLALIEQGLQVFSSIYKRVYRGLKAEFIMLYHLIGAYGDPNDYLEVLDDPEADFAADFSGEGKDVLPVSDPSVATKMQAMGKAQLLMGLIGKGGNDRAIMKRAFEAFEIDDPEELLPVPMPPNPAVEAKAQRDQAAAEKDVAAGRKLTAEAAEIVARNTAGANPRGVPGMAGPSPDEMGLGGAPEALGGPEGGMA